MPSYFDNTSVKLDELTDRIAKGLRLLDWRISRGMDVSGLARQLEYDIARATFIVVDVTDTFNQPYPETK